MGLVVTGHYLSEINYISCVMMCSFSVTNMNPVSQSGKTHLLGKGVSIMFSWCPAKILCKLLSRNYKYTRHVTSRYTNTQNYTDRPEMNFLSR